MFYNTGGKKMRIQDIYTLFLYYRTLINFSINILYAVGKKMRIQDTKFIQFYNTVPFLEGRDEEGRSEW